MTSIKSLKLFQYCNIGYKLRSAPLKQNLVKQDGIVNFKTTSVLDNWYDEFLYYIITSCHIGLRLSFLGLGWWYEFTHEPSMAESCTFYFVALIETTSLTVQLSNLFFLEKTLVIAESYNVFCRKFLTVVKLNQKKSDGGNTYLKYFLILAAVTTVFSFPTSYFTCYFGYHFHSLLSKGSIKLSLISTCIMTFVYFMDFVFVFHYVASAISYAVVTGRVFKYCKWKEGLTPPQKYQRLILFRGLQIYNKYLMNDAHIKEGTLWSIGVGCALIILPSFALISYSEQIDMLFLCAFVAIILITTIITKAILKLINDMIDMSAEFIESYQREGKQSLSKYEQLSFNCCKPMEMLIGSFEKIRRETFPYLMQEIVLAYIIDFVLAAREIDSNDISG